MFNTESEAIVNRRESHFCFIPVPLLEEIKWQLIVSNLETSCLSSLFLAPKGKQCYVYANSF
jgi:hypothetical protein